MKKDLDEMFGEVNDFFHRKLVDKMADVKNLNRMTGRINHSQIVDLKDLANKFYSLVSQLEKESR